MMITPLFFRQLKLTILASALLAIPLVYSPVARAPVGRLRPAFPIRIIGADRRIS